MFNQRYDMRCISFSDEPRTDPTVVSANRPADARLSRPINIGTRLLKTFNASAVPPSLNTPFVRPKFSQRQIDRSPAEDRKHPIFRQSGYSG